MNQNDKGAIEASQLQRISCSILGVMLLSLPLLISSPSMAGSDVPVDPALVLPPDPVWPAPPMPDASNPAPDLLSMTPVLDPMAASGITAMPVLTVQSGVPATLP